MNAAREPRALLALLDERPEGWARGPLPSPIDATVAGIVDGYLGGDEEMRTAILDGLTVGRASTIAASAERMASLAVRDENPEPLVRGLVAIGLAATKVYEKELVLLLPLFWRSAERLGVDGTLLFTSAADLLGDIAPTWVRAFPDRTPKNRTLATMGYEEHDEPNGALYRRTW